MRGFLGGAGAVMCFPLNDLSINMLIFATGQMYDFIELRA
ncbi:MAG: hypothetical protein ACJAUW_000774, partial [Yoonia sp.]